MARGNQRDPSPLRSGIVHAGLSLSVFGGIAAVIGAGVHFTGDASAAGPRQIISLFEAAPSEDPGLVGRLPDQLQAAAVRQPQEPSLNFDAVNEPTLDVAMPSLSLIHI